ncbi:hypothetical protein EOL70_10555 [Leucothrix sargassi]|nr:hypothetical protein EOL70_10555 [Leucothrix sargassi]
MKKQHIAKPLLLGSTLLLPLFASTQAGGLIAKPDRLNTKAGQAKTVEVLWNDRGGHFWVSNVNKHSVNGGRAYVVAGKKIHYTPKPGFKGKDEFWYEITDSHGRTNSSKVTVNVAGGHKQKHKAAQHKKKHHKPSYSVQWSKPGFNFSYSKPGGWQATISPPQPKPQVQRTPHHHRPAVAKAPVGHSDAYVTYSGSGQIALDVLTNDKGVGLSVQNTNPWTARGGQAWVVNDHNGSYIAYTPKAGFQGIDELWYVLRDQHGRTNSTKVSISVH